MSDRHPYLWTPEEPLKHQWQVSIAQARYDVEFLHDTNCGYLRESLCGTVLSEAEYSTLDSRWEEGRGRNK